MTGDETPRARQSREELESIRKALWGCGGLVGLFIILLFIMQLVTLGQIKDVMRGMRR